MKLLIHFFEKTEQNTMSREELISWLIEHMFQNPTPNNRDWAEFLSQMTNNELNIISRVQRLSEAGILTRKDITPFVDILQKYNPGSIGVVYENHDPDVDLFDKPCVN